MKAGQDSPVPGLGSLRDKIPCKVACSTQMKFSKVLYGLFVYYRLAEDKNDAMVIDG